MWIATASTSAANTRNDAPNISRRMRSCRMNVSKCSGAIDDDLFSKIVDSAAADAHRPLRTVRWLSQGPDHPVLTSFPEGRYLKGLQAVAPA